MSTRFSVLLLCAVLAGCAAGAGGSSGPRSGSNVLLGDEIASANLTNLYDVIQQLRPQYLRGRGNSSISGGADVVRVYLNGSEFGGPESLRTIQTGNIERVEFVRGPDTAVRFGIDNPGGVINVVMNTGG